MNILRARELLENLFNQGVNEFCVCAGSRNSPLVVVLENTPNIRCYSFFEERSAAFFALGRIKRTACPVAVVTTSGTAAAELLPATIEAHYSTLPLVLITADRPPEYRGTASPQAIEQIGLYSHYVAATFDLTDGAATTVRLSPHRPVHINICFDEPLLDGPIEERALAAITKAVAIEAFAPENAVRKTPAVLPRASASGSPPSITRPLVILGRINAPFRAQVERILHSLQAPVFAEGPSGLRESSLLSDLILQSGDQILKSALARRFDCVIRIGSVPTARFWRDLEKLPLPVFSFSSEPFHGLARSEVQWGYQGGHDDLHQQNFVSQLEQWAETFVAGRVDQDFTHTILTYDRQKMKLLEQILFDEPHSEVSWFRWLSLQAKHSAHIFVGNSLPIRQWDLSATYQQRNLQIEVNRGANGIDGQLSTFLGTASKAQENWGIFGDLTTLYDLSAPWVLSQLDPMVLRLVVINNFGGQIFSRLFSSPGFLNAHQLQFKNWAQMWNLPYVCWQEQKMASDLPPLGVVVEIQPDAAASQRFWQRYGELWKNQ